MLLVGFLTNYCRLLLLWVRRDSSMLWRVSVPSFILIKVSGDIGRRGSVPGKEVGGNCGVGRLDADGGKIAWDWGGIGEDTLATARNFSLMNAGRCWDVNRGIGLWIGKWDFVRELSSSSHFGFRKPGKNDCWVSAWFPDSYWLSIGSVLICGELKSCDMKELFGENCLRWADITFDIAVDMFGLIGGDDAFDVVGEGDLWKSILSPSS